MVTETFFDLQRFADDTLIGSTVDGSFRWAGGGSFGGYSSGQTVTSSAPTYLSSTGAASVALPTIYFQGTNNGYSFAGNENSADWEVSIKGASNIVGGDFSNGTGAYLLSGEVTVTAQGTKDGFTETVNGAPVYFKTKNEQSFVAAANNYSSAMTLTFDDGVANATVGVDSNDTVVFSGAAEKIAFTTDTSEESTLASNPLTFAAAATVVADGDGIAVHSGNNTITNAKTGEIAAYQANGTATITSNNVIAGVSGVTVTTSDGFQDATTVNGVTWDSITGSMNSIIFEEDGDAHVDNTGAVTVEGEADKYVGFSMLTTAGVTANGAQIKAVGSSFASFAIQLEDGGIKGFAFDHEDEVVRVSNDTEFEVMSYSAATGASAVYTIGTNANYVVFDGNTDGPDVTIQSGYGYTVAGAEAEYAFQGGITRNSTATATINGAAVSIVNNKATVNGDVSITSSADTEGIAAIAGVNMNDAVNVTGDADGYIVTFNAADTTDTISVNTISANSLNLQVSDTYAGGDVTLTVDSVGTAASVQGIAGSDDVQGEVTVHGGTAGAKYQFRNSNENNLVKVSAGQTVIVDLDSVGNVVDTMTAATAERYANDQEKWEQIASYNPNGNPYTDFKYLDFSEVASNTVAGYTSDYDTAPVESVVSGGVNIIGESPLGTPMALGEALHVTLNVGADAGQERLTIYGDESDAVKDVTVDYTNSGAPASVYADYISASHKIYLSGNGTSSNPDYGYIGPNATGENLLQAGSGAAMMRHDGTTRASVFGGSGNDTIWASKNDIVKGGAGADLFYDANSYTVRDYDETEGDAIIATRLDALSDVTYDNVNVDGNKVQFGNGGTMTIMDEDRADGDYVHVKVAVMDEDGNVLSGRRDVAFATASGDVNATAAGSNGALIIANSKTDNYVNNIIGSAGDDVIYAGSGDTVRGGEGNDDIKLDSGSTGAVIAMDGGMDTVEGWSFGFDQNAGSTKLSVGGAAFGATIKEDQLVVTISGGTGVTFADTKNYGSADSLYGQFDILVDDKKYTVIRSGAGAYVADNDKVADIYFAEADGSVLFGSGITDDLNIDLTSDSYQNIRDVVLFNNSNASVIGGSARETVYAYTGETSWVSLGGGNDVIYSDGDLNDSVVSYGDWSNTITSSANVFFFGKGDGRDTIHAFSHYQGVDADPAKQSTDLLVVDDFKDLHVASYAGDSLHAAGDRIVFSTSDEDDVVIYETGGIADSYNDKMYRVKIDGLDEAVAKIGYSDSTGNDFTYDEEVSYYVGAAGTANDTLSIGDDVANVEVWLDSTHGKFFRGIGVVDASEATGTNVSIAGSMDNNTINGGGEGSTTFMWGGAGDNVLNGDVGHDFFMYYKDSRSYIDGAAGMAEANHDVVNNYTVNEDTIFLGDITLDDINAEAMVASGNNGIGADSITVQFNNGGTLTVNGTQSETKFTMVDGTVAIADRNSRTWRTEVTTAD